MHQWQQPLESFRSLLSDETRAPLDRLRSAVHEFVRSECEETGLRVALVDAVQLYRDAPSGLRPDQLQRVLRSTTP